MTIRKNERDEFVQEYSFSIEIKLLLIQSRLFKCKMLSNSQGNHWEKLKIYREKEMKEESKLNTKEDSMEKLRIKKDMTHGKQIAK